MQLKQLYQLFLIVFLATHFSCKSQNTEELKYAINKIVKDKKATIGLSIIVPHLKDTLSLHGDKPFPMQSVFKFHIALAVLAEIDKGKFSLNQQIKIGSKHLLPNLWSPLRENHPNGGFFSIAELIQYAVAKSDNVACDALLRLIGSPKKVEVYLKKNGFTNFSIHFNEENMQAQWENMFQNWMTPNTSSLILQNFYNPKQQLLSKKSYDFIWETMKSTSTAPKRIKGALPAETVVAHKTGTSGTHEGLTAAINDIGIVFLPNGKYYIISIFITHSFENDETNDQIIADITKSVYDFYNAKN